MIEPIRHRGPDDHGTWVDEAAGVALAHRRLSILDLSPAGHQPMAAAEGRYHIVYNGEIYNHPELRRELEHRGVRFRGHSDTEVLLAGVVEWGVEATIRRAVGMFAFAVWDGAARRLILARDRLGIKPLYAGWQNGVFLFGSELKSLRVHPAFAGEIDRGALALYVRHGYVPGPYSIHHGIEKLPPGTWVALSENTGPGPLEPVPFWSLQEAADRGTREPFRGTDEDAVEELDRRLRDAVALRMEADVPVGAFLSGGIDSSTVVALMQAQSTRRVSTFSIGYGEAAHNEAPYAKAVAEHLGTDHREQIVTPDEAREVIPRLPTLYDEPFADSSQIPTFLVSALARRNVTVSLSGDGGDELFGGYRRFSTTETLWRKISRMPLPWRAAAAGVLGRIAPRRSDTRFNRRLRTLSEILGVEDGRGIYTWLHSHWRDPAELVVGNGAPPTVFTDLDAWARRDSLREELMFIDTITYLPDDILVKVDRASMAVSLEARVPVLDHRVVEFAWTLPPALKFRKGGEKWLLRRVLDRYVPARLIDRPKVGFSVPIESWLRGPLRDWAEDLLDENRLRREGFFHPGPIRRKWSEHLAGTQEWHHHLWDVLMFEAWIRETRGVTAAAGVGRIEGE